MRRLAKAFWFITFLVGFVTILYVYAGLPETVILNIDDTGATTVMLGRDNFFYLVVAFMALFNVGLYTLVKVKKYKSETITEILATWNFTFAGLLNLFVIVAAHFFSILNSGETFHYDNFGYLIFASLALIVVWIVALPVMVVKGLKF